MVHLVGFTIETFMPLSYLRMSFKLPLSWKSGSRMHNCSQTDISTSSLLDTIITSSVTSAAQKMTGHKM
jgi:hypothetical protein